MVSAVGVSSQGGQIVEENWRRRPDLNRGWRFCRQGLDVYLVDSSCFLVGPTPPSCLVFGCNCSQIVPKFARRSCETLCNVAVNPSRWSVMQ
jgi:hypothetical protein